jgi:hypothetical protein
LQAAAMAVTDSDEVLLASTASGATIDSSSMNRSRLTSSRSMIASMTRSQSAKPCRASTGVMRAIAGGCAVGGHASLFGELAERVAQAVEGGLNGGWLGVEEDGFATGLGIQLDDAASHCTGADDAHVLECLENSGLSA